MLVFCVFFLWIIRVCVQWGRGFHLLLVGIIVHEIIENIYKLFYPPVPKEESPETIIQETKEALVRCKNAGVRAFMGQGMEGAVMILCMIHGAYNILYNIFLPSVFVKLCPYVGEVLVYLDVSECVN